MVASFACSNPSLVSTNPAFFDDRLHHPGQRSFFSTACGVLYLADASQVPMATLFLLLRYSTGEASASVPSRKLLRTAARVGLQWSRLTFLWTQPNAPRMITPNFSCATVRPVQPSSQPNYSWGHPHHPKIQARLGSRIGILTPPLSGRHCVENLL